MIIFLYGQDTYRARQRLHTLRDAFKEKFDRTGMNTVSLDGEILTTEAFNKQFNASGFLADKRFLSVQNLFAKGKEDVQRSVLEMLSDTQFMTDNILVFLEEGDLSAPKKRKASSTTKGARKKKVVSLPDLFPELLAKAKKEEFPALDPQGVAEWVEKEVKKFGGTIDKKAVTLLASRVGNDLWQASQEVAKLAHYAQGRIIVPDDVDIMIQATFDDNIFRLTDALGSNDVRAAMNILEEQFELGAEPLYLLRMLTWHVRNLVSVRSLQDTGVVTAQAVANQLKMHPFVAQKTMRQTAYFSLQDLLAVYDRLLAIDQKLKTGSANAPALLDLLLLALTKSSAQRSTVA